jgi:hypothetical protein
MPGPNVRTQIITGHLQNVSLDWQNPMYQMNEIIPMLEMPTRSAKVTIFNRGDAFRNTASIRARGTKTETSNYKMTTATITTEQYANKNQITKEDLRDAGLTGNLTPPLDMRSRAIAWNSDKLDMQNEIMVADAVKAGTWVDGNSGGEDAGGLWAASDSTNTAIEDIDTAILAIKDAGVPRNNIRVAMDDTTFQKLIRCTDVKAALAYNAVIPKSSDMVITADMLASLFTVEKVVVCSAIYNSANETAAGTDFTAASIWGGSKGFGFVYYYPPVVERNMMSPGFNAWNKMENGSRRATYTWYDDEKHAWQYESHQEVGYKQTAAQAGYLFKDTHTS